MIVERLKREPITPQESSEDTEPEAPDTEDSTPLAQPTAAAPDSIPEKSDAMSQRLAAMKRQFQTHATSTASTADSQSQPATPPTHGPFTFMPPPDTPTVPAKARYPVERLDMGSRSSCDSKDAFERIKSSLLALQDRSDDTTLSSVHEALKILHRVSSDGTEVAGLSVECIAQNATELFRIIAGVFEKASSNCTLNPGNPGPVV